MAKNTLPVAMSMPKQTSEDKQREMDYRAKDALSDIERAEMHKRDKELMKHVKKHAKEKIKSMNKICGGD